MPDVVISSWHDQIYVISILDDDVAGVSRLQIGCCNDIRGTPALTFLQAGCPSCHPTDSVKALKDKIKNQFKQLGSQGLCKTLILLDFCLNYAENG